MNPRQKFAVSSSLRSDVDLAMLFRHLLSAPFVYGLLAPIALLDGAVSAYQAVCFRLWRIPAVPRSAHLILDRHKLPYLNGPQKVNCLYCGYANGVLSYAREIASRTEQYWCPIKHERAPEAPHARYAHFIDYGDAAGLIAQSPILRAGVQRPHDLVAPPVKDKVKSFTRHLATYPIQD